MRRPERTSLGLRLAATCFIAEAGFAVTTPITLGHLARTGELPMSPFGFRSLSGPFEQFGQEAFTALGWALVAVCTLDVLAGSWLWQRKRRGAKLGLATTPIAFTLAIGFALPFFILVVPVRIGLVLADWRSLR